MNFKATLKQLPVICLGILFPFTLTAGNDDVSITYDLTVEEGLDAASAAMIKGSEMIVRMKGDNIRMDIHMAGTTQTVLTNKKDNTTVMLIEAMGNKLKMTAPAEDDPNQPQPEITYTDATKTVAGYKCKKALVKMPGSDDTLVVYYTDELPGYVGQFKGLKGFPLEYEMNQNGLKMLAVAKNVSREKIDDDIYTVPDGYTEMTPEMLEMMGK